MSFPGGKGNTFRHIINLMPPHKTYVETHLGGGSVFLNKMAAAHNILIDINPDVLSSFRSSHPELNNHSYRFFCCDALEFLKINKFGPDCLIYIDPPYLLSTRKSGRIYKYEYSISDHVSLLNFIVDLNCMVLISSYPNDLYGSILSSWNLYKYQSVTRSGSLADECLWYNFPRSDYLHDYNFFGRTFREREILRRQSKRWCSRLSKMSPLRRHFLLMAIGSTFKPEIIHIFKYLI